MNIAAMKFFIVFPFFFSPRKFVRLFFPWCPIWCGLRKGGGDLEERQEGSEIISVVP